MDDQNKQKPVLTIRKAGPQDKEFAFQTKEAALREYVEQSRGWDEAEQWRLHEERFATQEFQVVRCGEADVGILSVDRQPRCVTVNQIYILPEHQNQGIGSLCVATILDEAATKRIPVRLKVLKVNQRAIAFYERLRFHKTDESDTHIFMEWSREAIDS